MLSMRMEQLSGWEFTGTGETWALLKVTKVERKLERKLERNGIVF